MYRAYGTEIIHVMSDPKTRHHRYRQFSLRTFLLVLTLVCVWFGWQVNRGNRQRKAVAWVEQMGGFVSYDYEVDDEGNAIADTKPTSPEWLRDFYDQVVVVDLSGSQVSDLTPLANLKSLQELYLWHTQFSEEQITKLQKALPNCEIHKH